MDIRAIIDALGLVTHPAEGGYFAETHRSDIVVPMGVLPEHCAREKALSTAIYYLLTADTFSAMHRLRSDEVFHFYSGDPVEMLQLWPGGSHRVIEIGSDVLRGQSPQVVVPRGVWQGSRLKPDGEYALMGTTVSPAFDYDDYEPGVPADLVERYPACADLIRSLTRG